MTRFSKIAIEIENCLSFEKTFSAVVLNLHVVNECGLYLFFRVYFLISVSYST